MHSQPDVVPLAFFITLPGLCAAIFVLALALPQLTYIYFADPIDSKKPLFASTIRRCLQVDYALLRIANEAFGVGRRIARDLLLRRVQRHRNYQVLWVIQLCAYSLANADFHKPGYQL